jgi:hypothetical protein
MRSSRKIKPQGEDVCDNEEHKGQYLRVEDVVQKQGRRGGSTPSSQRMVASAVVESHRSLLCL